VELQDVVDQLATNLARSVVINNLRFQPLASSAQGDEIDAIRTATLLKRVTPEPARAYLEELGVRESTRPMTVDLTALGGRERLAVPIRDEAGPLATLWLITGGLPPLTGRDYVAIDSAVLLARGLLAASRRADEEPEGIRRQLLRRLMDDHADARCAAMKEAVRSRLLSTDGSSVVLVVALDASTSDLDRAAYVTHSCPLRLRLPQFVGEHTGHLVFLAREPVDEAVAALRERAAQVGVDLRAIGSAPVRDVEDLLPIVRDATAAARIVSRVPALGGYSSIHDLGTWDMLSEVPWAQARVARYSPAAHALLFEADPVQRETVETYLDTGGNVRAACELLHLHRTTLYYRLENLPEVVRVALDDGMARSALHLCLKLTQFRE
jgi:hypothetical protein